MTSLSPENEDTLEEIASITGGEYVRAEEGTGGVTQIRSELAKLQASERKARRVTVHENRFALLLLPGFITDALGFVLLISPIRRALVLGWLRRSGTLRPGQPPPPRPGHQQFNDREHRPSD